MSTNLDIIMKNDSVSCLLFLSQKFNSLNPHLSTFGTEVELNELRETIQQLLRWGWKFNRNLEEQAAQLHMLTGWSQIVEVSSLFLSFLSGFPIIPLLVVVVLVHYYSFFILVITAASQVSASRRISALQNRSETLFQWVTWKLLHFCPFCSGFLLKLLVCSVQVAGCFPECLWFSRLFTKDGSDTLTG